MPNLVPGVGNFQADLMIVAEAPGAEEDMALEPLVGPTGMQAQMLLHDAGGKWHETWRTNVCKYRPPLNDFKKLHLINVDLAEQIKNLWEQEIRVVKPKCILALGEQALNALTGLEGIFNYRGSILRSKDGDYKVVPTIHPANLLRRPGIEPLPHIWRKIMLSDFERAVEESKYREFRLPERYITVAQSSLDVFRFFREYEKLGKRAEDIESINCIPSLWSCAYNRNHALVVPLLRGKAPNVLTDMSKKELAECYKMIDKSHRGYDGIPPVKIVGQNFKYDEFKLSRVGFGGMELYSDTLLKTRTIFPELPAAGLGMQTSLFTREPYYKDEGKEVKVTKGAVAKFNIPRYLNYSGKDSCVTIEIDEVLEPMLIGLGDRYGVDYKSFFYDYVMRKHAFYLKMENRGWKIDFEKKAKLLKDYTAMKEETHARFIKRIGFDVNVKSYPQVFELLYKYLKFPAMKRDPTSEDTIVALLGNHCKGANATEKASILEDLLEERRIRNQISRDISFVPDYDGRWKTSYRICGTETSRTSTSILNKPLRPEKIGSAFHTIAKHGKFAKDIRSMAVPDPGMVIIKTDSSQAEARIVSVLMEDWELLKAFDTIDIHRRTAGLLFGFTQRLILDVGHIAVVDDIGKDDPERFCGKKTRHAGNYDMKKHMFMTILNTDAQKFGISMRVNEWRAGNMLELFHAASPRIRSKFHTDIKDALQAGRVLINPFGRIRQFNGAMDESLFKEGYAQIPQSTVADLVQGAALKCDDEFNGDANVYFCSEDHDALALQAPANDWERYARVLQHHMMAEIDFNTHCTLKRDFKLVIPSDVEVSLDKEGNITNLAHMMKAKL